MDDNQSPQPNIPQPLIPTQKSRWRRFPAFRELGVVLGVLLFVFAVTYFDDIKNHLTSSDTLSEEADPILQNAQPNPYEASFDELSLEARAVYVYDVRDEKVLFQKNAEDTLPLASVTKLMTALVAHELLSENATVRIGQGALAQDGDSGFLKDEAFTARDLLDLTLINSSNDGAYALASAAGSGIFETGDGALTFVDAMNIRAEEIGLSKTLFKNPTGLDLSVSESGADGSAKDMALLMEHLITTYPDVLEETKAANALIANASGATHVAENTNKIVSDIPGLIASKTGYTDLAGGNLVVAFDAGLNHPIVIAILGSSQLGRFEDVRQLVAASITTTLTTD